MNPDQLKLIQLLRKLANEQPNETVHIPDNFDLVTGDEQQPCEYYGFVSGYHKFSDMLQYLADMMEQ